MNLRRAVSVSHLLVNSNHRCHVLRAYQLVPKQYSERLTQSNLQAEEEIQYIYTYIYITGQNELTICATLAARPVNNQRSSFVDLSEL